MQFLAFFSPSSKNFILAVQLRIRGKQFYFTNQIIWKLLDVQTDKLGRYGLVSAKKITCIAHENYAFFQSKWSNGWNLLGSPICYAQEQKSAQLMAFCTSFPHNPHPAQQILAQSLLHKTWELAASKGHWWHSNKRCLCCYCFCLPLLPIALSRVHCIGQAFGGSRSSGQLPEASNQ